MTPTSLCSLISLCMFYFPTKIDQFAISWIYSDHPMSLLMFLTHQFHLLEIQSSYKVWLEYHTLASLPSVKQVWLPFSVLYSNLLCNCLNFSPFPWASSTGPVSYFYFLQHQSHWIESGEIELGWILQSSKEWLQISRCFWYTFDPANTLRCLTQPIHDSTHWVMAAWLPSEAYVHKARPAVIVQFCNRPFIVRNWGQGLPWCSRGSGPESNPDSSLQTEE